MVIIMEKLIKKIAANMIKTRPRDEVKLRPFIKYPGVEREILGYINIDLDKIYPDAKQGDYVYVKTFLLVPHDGKIALTTKGNVSVVYRGELVPDTEKTAELDAYEGMNETVFRCVKDEKGFKFSYIATTVYYTAMWATDYLYWIRPVLDGEYSGEEGMYISGLCSEEYVMPSPTACTGYIDFTKLFGGRYALALTYAGADFEPDFGGSVYVDGAPYTGGVVKAGSQVAVIFERSDKWGFDGNGDFYAPQLTSARENGKAWLLLELEDDTLPEIQFKKPYAKGFWRLADGSYVRPYLDTSFFGKWFYALMVGQYGLMNAAQYLDAHFYDYFVDSMQIMADHFDYMRYDASVFGAPTFLERSIRLADLDSIGTMGMNLCELYRINKDKNVLAVIEALRDAMYKNIPRFEDGTFNRKETMWSDDTFMSCPFLVRLWQVTGDDKYLQECVDQLAGFYKKLYISEKDLFSHIFFVNDGKASRVPWGRGNGWVFITLTEVMMRMSETDPRFTALLDIFRGFAKGIAAVQDQNGMWHQVMTMSDTYEETSCTGMFAIGMLRGAVHGWIDKEYIGNTERAVAALCEKSIDTEGNVLGVCRGSGCSYDPGYYAQLGTIDNDDHGTGIILTLFAEYLNYKKSTEGNN